MGAKRVMLILHRADRELWDGAVEDERAATDSTGRKLPPPSGSTIMKIRAGVLLESRQIRPINSRMITIKRIKPNPPLGK